MTLGIPKLPTKYSDSSTSFALSVILKDFDKSLVHKIVEIEIHSIEQRHILLTQYKLIIDGLSQDIYQIAGIDYNPKWCSVYKSKTMTQ